MSCSQYFLHKFMGMGCVLKTMLGTDPNTERDSHVHCEGSFNQANTLEFFK